MRLSSLLVLASLCMQGKAYGDVMIRAENAEESLKIQETHRNRMVKEHEANVNSFLATKNLTLRDNLEHVELPEHIKRAAGTVVSYYIPPFDEECRNRSNSNRTFTGRWNLAEINCLGAKITTYEMACNIKDPPGSEIGQIWLRFHCKEDHWCAPYRPSNNASERIIWCIAEKRQEVQVVSSGKFARAVARWVKSIRGTSRMFGHIFIGGQNDGAQVDAELMYVKGTYPITDGNAIQSFSIPKRSQVTDNNFYFDIDYLKNNMSADDSWFQERVIWHGEKFHNNLVVMDYGFV